MSSETGGPCTGKPSCWLESGASGSGPMRKVIPDYITMEQGGVNGLSSLPNTREGMAELAAHCPDVPEARKGGNPQTVKTWRAIAHYAGTIFLWVFKPTVRRAPAARSGAGFCAC